MLFCFIHVTFNKVYTIKNIHELPIIKIFVIGRCTVMYFIFVLNVLYYNSVSLLCFRWRIVIHGGIDGYSRLIVFLRASNNNCSSTVMNCFLNAVAMYGVPSRVRTDHGGENNDVCVMMNIFRGSERGSAFRGRSTHNQRIERLWGDVAGID